MRRVEECLQEVVDKFRELKVEDVSNKEAVRTVMVISDFANLIEEAADEIRRLRKKAGEL